MNTARVFAKLAAGCVATGCGILMMSCVTTSGAPRAQTIDHEEQRYFANAHTYLDDTNAQIILQIPELKSLRASADQEALPNILDKVGTTVDEFYSNAVNVIAREKIVEQKFSSDAFGGRQEVDDNYLILRHGIDTRADIEECRVDAYGKRLDQAGLEKGFFVTSNFALNSVYFKPEYQGNSRFRYLGEQKLDGRDAFVVAFAQKPGQASVSIAMQGKWNDKPYLVHMLSQGVAWIDKNDFRILRMRTDLLAPRRDIGLLRLTTEVEYAAEPFAGATSPVWLIHSVKVYAHFSRVEVTSAGVAIFDSVFRNEHLLTDYRRFAVNASVGGEAVTAAEGHSEDSEDAPDTQSYLKVPAQMSKKLAPTYVEAPLEEIVKLVPDLKSLRANEDQKLLPAILQ